MITPTSEAIAQKVRITGLTWDRCAEILTEEGAAQYQRLTALSPNAEQELTKAQERADAERDRASVVVSRLTNTLANLEASICSYGKLHRDTLAIRALGMIEDDAQTMATLLFDTLLSNIESSSTQKQSTVDYCYASLTRGLSIAPFVKQRVVEMEAKATQLATQIRATAKAEKISLAKLITTMQAEAFAVRPGSNQRKNAEIATWFEQGFFEGLK